MRKTTKIETPTRGDSELAREILRKMKDDFEVPDVLIRLKVADGFVTLEGVVDHSAQKDATEKCVKRVKGVRGITNKLEVAPATSAVEAR